MTVSLCCDNVEPTAGATALDHEGAVIWVACPTCSAGFKQACHVGRIGLDIAVLAPPDGQVHAGRMSKWLEFKARVSAGAGASRRPNMQQFPRYPRRR